MLNKLLFSEDKSHLGRCTREDPREVTEALESLQNLLHRLFKTQVFTISSLQFFLCITAFTVIPQVLLAFSVKQEFCFDTEKSLNK